MDTPIHSVALALENIYQRLYHIEAATTLLQQIECGDIEDLQVTHVTFTTLVSEALTDAMSGIFDECDEISSYLEEQGGERFLKLAEKAKQIQLTELSGKHGELLS
ncbi:MAG: hypothetical protein JAY85_06020 [Candidatus Thiodiazotropha weberae]|uniref:Uncharacterized protein n=1 Tax=Candidatus Thiodiazotropha endoloripes TaxID=1818881 RepID=A0A1E2US33_9GAMM|nr:hypothetical protein [Candidatus Thiodiazotropha endoloripes]MCG7897997.1 hypothetical protein [Candidatus Thiodiazotropha weberae]ODB86444.1 hypothetical protein A3195_12605 [Candidatus Thiodiazotropha endoloripes]ODB88475.1 hypothetical protein A3193_06395 [Candidatus Thiodiazotropha endoloripes]ODB97563.1 hypothetical protein A3196_12835 [Candidatus Thiodiazotropha endoloripes]